MVSIWQLDPSVDHLNHGSYGATPTPVLRAQQALRDEMERNPVRFMDERYQPLLNHARGRVAEFVGADPADVVFVNNVTAGVAAVLTSLEAQWGPGDEIVLTNHAYNAFGNAAAVAASRSGATTVTAEITLPIESPDTVFEAVIEKVTPRTRLVLIEHVTSPTAAIFPVERIVEALEPDIPVLVDGAHAPGMVDLDLDRIGASYSVGNCHKWMCAAKGAGYLHARPDKHDGLSAAIVSHGHNRSWPGSDSSFHARFDWLGTDDATAWFTVPEAIDAVADTHPEGWLGVRRANHDLVVAARRILLETLGVAAPVPEAMIGSMASLPLPGLDTGTITTADPLLTALRNRWNFEVPVVAWLGPPPRLLRISAHRYNTIEQYEHLADALTVELVIRATR